MRRGFKPYSKRKIFKRKTGGPKFLLHGGLANTTFSKQDMVGNMASLIALITKSKKRTA